MGVEDWVFFFVHTALKSSNEAVIESMGCILDQHAAPGRHLPQHAYAEEAYIHWNGPRPHEATKLLVAALNRYFDNKPWHFTKSDRGAREGALDRTWGRHKQWKVSKVVDRLASQPSRVPFMAD